MKIVTIASHRPQQPYYTYAEFFASCRRYGHEPIVLGGQKQGVQMYGGLGSKPRLLKQAIESGGITDDWILFCDCFDVVFQSDPLEALQALFKRPELIVWNAEKNCFPQTTLAGKHPKSDTSFRFFNSGFSIGKTSAYLDLLKWMNVDWIPDDKQRPDGSWETPNDQELFMRAFLLNDTMGLDTKAEICQTLCGVEENELDFSGDKIRNKETGSTPIAFHINGGCKEFWKPRILSKLNL